MKKIFGLNKTENIKANTITMAILAATLYGISSPVSKVLLEKLSPTFMAALLYLGAGIGMLSVNIMKRLLKKEQLEAKITIKELPFVVAMILLDIAAPILLMLGLTLSNASTVSLLNNFEIVATSMIALLIFQESVGKRMWIAISLITVSSILLSVQDLSALSFSIGSVFVLLACICWGFENNCTRMLSLKDPIQIVVIKGFGSGIGALMIALYLGDAKGTLKYIAAALLLGFVAYGFSVFLYIKAQRELGAARTSAYYAAAPFIGVVISWIVLKESITQTFLISLAIMIVGTYLAVTENHKHAHIHKLIQHEHKHRHDDDHHVHYHEQGDDLSSEHTHLHDHEPTKHIHSHLPDMHHNHNH